MAEYEKSIELINQFFTIEQSENFSNEIFQTLQKIINFDSGYIFYTNPIRLEYSYNPKTNNIYNIQGNYLVEYLKIKNTIFGKITNIQKQVGQGGNSMVCFGKLNNEDVAVKVLINYNEDKKNRFYLEYYNIIKSVKNY